MNPAVIHNKSYPGLLGLCLLTGVESLIFGIGFSTIKAEPGNQIILGLSAWRLMIVIGLFIIALFSFSSAYILRTKRAGSIQNIGQFFKRQQKADSFSLISLSLFLGQLILVNFHPESFGHYAEYFKQIRIILWWGVIIWGQVTLFFMIFNPNPIVSLSKQNLLYGLLALTLIIVWLLQSQDMIGRTATSWMGYFHIEDFQDANLGEIAQFYKDMRAGIPPVLSFLEIITAKVYGSTEIITREFYRLALLISYLIAAFIFARTLVKGIISAVLSLICLSATILISAQNPEIYDIFFPCFLLLFIFFCQHIAKKSRFSHLNTLWATLAGLFLALAELSRPFVLITMPFFILYAVLRLKQFPKRVLISFLVPILLISGGWHAKLLIFNNGQIFWSNHSGFNLYRAWKDVAEIPDPPEEPQTWDRRNQVHSQEHYLNSQWIQSRVLDYMVENPGDSAKYVFSRLLTFLRPRTSFFENPELGGILPNTYRFSFMLILIYLLLQLILLAFNFLKHPKISFFAHPEHTLLITISMMILILAIGEMGEEARLVLAILPLMVALPSYRRDEVRAPLLQQ